MNTVSILPQWFPDNARAELGDLNRFATLLDHYSVGEVLGVNEPYAQDPSIAANRQDWHEDFKDPVLGYFPAKVAITERLMGVRESLGSDGGVIKSLQLPADTVGEFAVHGTLPIDCHLIPIRHTAQEHSPQLYPVVEKDIALLGISANFKHSDMFSTIVPGRHTVGAFLTDDSAFIHMDQSHFTHPGIMHLGSNTLTTVGPTGIINLTLMPEEKEQIVGYDGIASCFSSCDTRYDADSVQELAEVGKVIRLTGWDIHSKSFGEFGKRYFDNRAKSLNRVLAFIMHSYVNQQ